MTSYKYRQQIIINNKLHDVKAHTKKELAAKIKKLQKAAGVSTAPEEPTVSQWIDTSLRIYKPGISPSALRGYQSKCNRHIAPYIGHLPLSAVTPVQCQQIMSDATHYATDTQRKIRQLLHFIFDTAITAGYINANPADRTTKPSQKPSQKRRILTSQEVQQVIDTIPQKPAYIIYGFMLFCGCRPSEASEIRYDDISDHTLHIRGTKTLAADRYVPIPDALINMIPSGSGYIATDSDGNSMSASTRRRLWVQFRVDAGLPSDIVPYCLRHTYTTSLMRAGVDIRICSRILGHSSIAITNDIYTHVQASDINQSLDLINSYLYKNTSTSSDSFQETLS